MLNRFLPVFLLSGLVFGGCGSPEPGQHERRADVQVMTREAQASMSPAEALQRLKEGNDRFVTGRSLQRNFPGEARATASGQYPFAAIVSCLDSRASAELVFDQGLGAVFSARLAGNILNEDVLGSLEFATQVAGAKLIVVVGHSACGAVKGACDNVELGHLTGLLNKIEPAVSATKARFEGDPSAKNPAFVNDVAREHVRLMVRHLLEQSPILNELAKRGSLKVAGGFQDLASGRVAFLE
jgi:carbonic anhydrase